MSRQNRGLMLKFHRSSIEAVSIKNYKIRNSRSDYTHILEYLCRVSFLTFLNIYKDYFKGHHKWCKGFHNCCYMHIVTGDKIALAHHILCKDYCVFAPKGFVTKELPNLHCWMNWRTLQPTSSSSWCVSHVLRFVYYLLATYWDLCIERRDCRYITSPIGYWDKSLTVSWY